MTKLSYQPKTLAKDQCFVMLPATLIGRATRSSFMSLRLQLEKRFSSNHVVTNMKLEEMAGMKKLILFVGDWEPVEETVQENQLRSSVSVSETIKQLNKIERWLSNHLQDKIEPTFENGILSLSAKPNIKAVPNRSRTKTAEPRLLLFDGSNVLTTAYYATKKHMLKNVDGTYTNAVYVMTKKILDLVSRSKASHLAIAWDEGREKTFRRALYNEYKANRSETEPELKQQFDTARKLFNKIGIAQFSHETIEADDVIGTISKRWEKESTGKCYIISNDKDLYQLLSDRTIQIISGKDKESTMTVNKLQEMFNVSPSQWIDCKAILGDSSDNIPGVTGVGEKAAYPLVSEYGSLEAIYENINKLDTKYKRYVKKLEDGKEMAFLSKKLVTTRTDVGDLIPFSIRDLELKLNRAEVVKQLRLIGFKSIIYQIESGALKIG